jgi:hypothetical protein
MRRTTFLISAICLLIIANVLMMSFASPVFTATGEGFVSHMAKKEKEGFDSHSEKKKETAGFQAHMAKKEGFRNYSGSPAGAKSSYMPMGQFDGVKLETGNGVSEWRYTSPNEPLRGPEVELGPDSLFMFKNNQCKPECCGASFSCDGGCVCTTPKQRKFINERGGNRTVGGDV